jgi:hypothetical protein
VCNQVLEKFVIIDDDGMKKQPWRASGHPEWTFVADEMHLVATAG